MPAFAPLLQLAGLDGSNGFKITGDVAGAAFGAGDIFDTDVNGDGVADLLFSAGSFFDPDTAYVVYGSADGFDPVVALSGLARADGIRVLGHVGAQVAGAGDINGDGFGDFIVASPGTDPLGEESAGTTYVVFGGDALPRTIDVTVLDGSDGFRLDGSSYDYTSASVSAAGDFNGDGFADIIVAGDVNTYQGGAYIIFGKASGFAPSMVLDDLYGSDGFAILGEDLLDYLGHSVAAAGDINGDGIDDIVIGARDAGNEVGGRNDYSGKCYVVFGTRDAMPARFDLGTLDGSNGFQIDGAAAKDHLSQVAGLGDINGDGFADVSLRSNSASYVLFGKASGFAAVEKVSSIDGSNGFVLSPAFSGLSCRAAGDVNGDGYDDFMFGAPGDAANGAASGAAYVVFGHKGSFGASLDLTVLDGTTGFKILGEAAGDAAGGTLTAGDVNNDGFGDIVIGASAAGDAGAAYVVYGHATAAIKRIGTDQADTFSGGEFDDRFTTLAGNDWVRAGDGADIVRAGIGSDRVDAGGGDDKVLAGAGNDRITGGLGSDVLVGDAGSDVFIYSDVAESTLEARDTIADFTIDAAVTASFIDRIDLSGIDANAEKDGHQHFNFIGMRTIKAVGQAKVIQQGDDAILFLNSSSADGSEGRILLKNVQADLLTAADFIL